MAGGFLSGSEIRKVRHHGILAPDHEIPNYFIKETKSILNPNCFETLNTPVAVRVKVVMPLARVLDTTMR